MYCKLSVSHIKEAYVTSTTRTQRRQVLCPFRCAAFTSSAAGRKAQQVKRDAAGQKGRRFSDAHRPRKRTLISPSAHILVGFGLPARDRASNEDAKLIGYRCRELWCLQSANSEIVRSNSSLPSAHLSTLCQAPRKRYILQLTGIRLLSLC